MCLYSSSGGLERRCSTWWGNNKEGDEGESRRDGWQCQRVDVNVNQCHSSSPPCVKHPCNMPPTHVSVCVFLCVCVSMFMSFSFLNARVCVCVFLCLFLYLVQCLFLCVYVFAYCIVCIIVFTCNIYFYVCVFVFLFIYKKDKFVRACIYMLPTYSCWYVLFCNSISGGGSRDH